MSELNRTAGHTHAQTVCQCNHIFQPKFLTSRHSEPYVALLRRDLRIDDKIFLGCRLQFLFVLTQKHNHSGTAD